MKSTAFSSTVDARRLEPRLTHAYIFSTFGALEEGRAIELVNDHDPEPLYRQFQTQWPNQFSWSVMEKGPDIWRVAIAKVSSAGAADAGPCCGACGGGR